MEQKLFALILVFGIIWLIADDFYGQKRLTGFVRGVLVRE